MKRSLLIKVIKRILKILLWLTLAISIVIFAFYYYLKSSWTDFISEEDFHTLVVDIRSAEALPERFYTLYESINTNSLTYNSKTLLLANCFRDKYVSSPSKRVAQFQIYEHNNPHSLLLLRFEILSWKLEEEVSQKECLNWILKRYDFMNLQIGINSASRFYFNKAFSELSDREYIGIIVLMKNPALYNPKRRPERFKNEIDKIANQLGL